MTGMQAESDIVFSPLSTEELFETVTERAWEIRQRSIEAQTSLRTARDYLGLLVEHHAATRPELRRAARVVCEARAHARWLVATSMVLQTRANDLARALEAPAQPFPDLDMLREEMMEAKLIRRERRGVS